MAASLVIGTPARNYNAHSAPMSVWTVRIGVFSLALIVVGVLGHRLFSMPTPVALNLFKVGFGGAALTFLVGGGALYQIWRRGSRGAATTGIGVAVALGIFAWPLAYLPTVRALPRINDVSTDMQAPPKFVALAKERIERGRGANNPAYPGATFAKAQTEAYPDIKPFVIDRSADEAFDIVIASLNRTLKMKIIQEDPPKGRYGNPGYVEAIDRTTVIGFTDDVVIRVDGDANTARVDVRSASRYGIHDLGRNATRVRRILKEIQWQVEATIPSSTGERVGRLRRGGRVVVPRRLKDGGTAPVAAGKAGPAKPGDKPATQTAAGKTPVPSKATTRDAEAPAKGKRQPREKFE
jgi:uncharacterized protein (DUF1499 family)